MPTHNDKGVSEANQALPFKYFVTKLFLRDLDRFQGALWLKTGSLARILETLI